MFHTINYFTIDDDSVSTMNKMKLMFSCWMDMLRIIWTHLHILRCMVLSNNRYSSNIHDTTVNHLVNSISV